MIIQNMKRKLQVTNNERNALAMALYNLAVRNNIVPENLINTMKDTRKKIRRTHDN